MKKLISCYINGNYKVILFDNGTKIRMNKLDNLTPDFPESMDMKISNYCPYNCPMCHENSSTSGAHGQILNNSFVNSLHKGTELAIGGGAVTYHPDLIPFLQQLKEKGIIPSITINQKEFETNKDLIIQLVNKKLIYGLGVSFVNFNEELWNEVLAIPNVVVHLIAGYHSIDVFKYFAQKKAKILILGFKNWGRGTNYLLDSNTEVDKQIEEVEKELPNLIDNCSVVSFDNLAISQLHLKDKLSEEDWNEFYMGDDGQYTMYADMVKQQFARTSTSQKRYDIADLTSEQAFNIIRNEN